MDDLSDQTQEQIPVRHFMEQLKGRRDWCIKEAEKLTRLLDYFDSHRDAQEFVKLFEELQQQSLEGEAQHATDA